MIPMSRSPSGDKPGSNAFRRTLRYMDAKNWVTRGALNHPGVPFVAAIDDWRLCRWVENGKLRRKSWYVPDPAHPDAASGQ